jgi:Peptidase A4 family
VPPGFAATWTGIGGYNTSDLIQAGTAEQSAPSNSLLGEQYYAWYELLPASETQLTGCSGDANCSVTTGERITVSISRVSGNTWTISMSDAGHWSWSKQVSYSSSLSSGEWILEAPTLVAGVGRRVVQRLRLRPELRRAVVVGEGVARSAGRATPAAYMLRLTNG